MTRDDSEFSIAIFPFLKTRYPIAIGSLTFRSTNDLDELPTEQAECVKEVSDMLFVQDDYRVESASYAILPDVSPSRPSPLDGLIHIQAAVAYMYSAPRHTFGDLFLSSEHASLAIYSPGRVSIHLVRRDYNVIAVENPPELNADRRREVKGYVGLYNFKHHFTAVRGSRIYGPIPHITLNHAQDLYADIKNAVSRRIDYEYLFDLIEGHASRTSSSIFTAIRWFNAANSKAADEFEAIVNLSIAFEALLNLPRNAKTERFTDSVSLLLGRTPRLDDWAQQFYDARSDIVHEGITEQLRFSVGGSQGGGSAHLYQSLLSYGRQIFQLCVGTILAGANLAERVGLEGQLVSNQERFESICTILDDDGSDHHVRLERISSLVELSVQYRYVPDSGLDLKALVGAARHASRVLLEVIGRPPRDLQQKLTMMATAERTENCMPELRVLEDLVDDASWKLVEDNPHARTVRKLLDVIWHYVFMHYYWLKRHGTDESYKADGGAESVTNSTAQG